MLILAGVFTHVHTGAWGDFKGGLGIGLAGGVVIWLLNRRAWRNLDEE